MKIKITAIITILFLTATIFIACDKPSTELDPAPAIQIVISNVIGDVNSANNLNLDDTNTVFRAFNTPPCRGQSNIMEWFADIHSLNFIARDSKTNDPYLIQANFNAVLEPITRNNIFSIAKNYNGIPKNIKITKVNEIILDLIRKIDETVDNELFKSSDDGYLNLDITRGKITYIEMSDTFIQEDSIGGNTYLYFDIYSLITYNTHLEEHAPQTSELEKVTTVSTILTSAYQEDLLLAVADFLNAVRNKDISKFSVTESYADDHYAGFIDGNDIPRSFVRLESTHEYQNSEQVKYMTDEQLIDEAHYSDRFPIKDFYIPADFGIPLEKDETMIYTRLNPVSSIEEAKNEVENFAYMQNPKSFKIDFIGENDYYYQFKLKYNYEHVAELLYIYRVIVYKDSTMYCTFNNNAGYRIEIRNLDKNIVLDLLDLEAYWHSLGRIIYRELNESDTEYIYTYYTVSITYGDWGLMDICLFT